MAKYLLLLFVLFFTIKAKAQHPEILGSHISYRAIDTLNYEVKLTVIRDCSGDLTALNDTLELLAGSLSIKQKPSFLSKKDITPIGENCNLKSICDSGTFPYGFEERIYMDTFNLAQVSDCDVYFIWTGNKRYSKITTGAANQNHFNFAFLNYCATKFNSSYTFTSSPKILAYEGQHLMMGIRSVDTLEINDSSTHHLQNPNSELYKTINYLSPYSKKACVTYLGAFRDPSQIPLPAGYYFDTLLCNLYTTPMKAGEQSTFCFETFEYRKINGQNIKIGSTRWDMALIIIKNTNKATYNNSTIKYLPINNFLCANAIKDFQFNSKDADASDSARFKIDFSGYKNITISDSFFTKDQSVFINWKPSAKDVRNIKSPYIINLKTHDNNCDVDGETSLNFPFYLDSMSSPKIELKDSLFCKGVDAHLKLNYLDSLKIKNILWDNKVDSLIYKISSSEIPKTFDVKVSDIYGCSYSKQLSINTFPTLNLEYNVSQETFCKDEDAHLSLNFSDKKNVKLITWNDSFQTDTFHILAKNIPSKIDIKITDLFGCNFNNNKLIDTFPTLNVDYQLSKTAFCKDEDAHLSLIFQDKNNVKSISWNDSFQNDSFHVLAKNIPSKIDIKITNIFSCNFSFNKFIDTFPKIKPIFQIQDSTCFNADSIVLKANYPNGIWNGNDVKNSVFYPSINNQGWQKIQYNFTDSNNCNQTDFHNLFVGFLAEPIAYVNPDTGKIPLNIYYNGDSLTYYDSYLWTFTNSKYVYKTNDNNNKIWITDTGHYDIKLTVAKNGCSNFVVVKNGIVALPKYYLNIQKNPDLADISVYPNPANEVLFVDFLSKYSNVEYQIFDLNGKEILKGILNDNKNEIQLKNLIQGFYLIEFKNENQLIFRTKFIKN